MSTPRISDSRLRRYQRYSYDADAKITETGRVCPDCDLFRTPREFQGAEDVYENCAPCRSKGRPARIAKQKKRARSA